MRPRIKTRKVERAIMAHIKPFKSTKVRLGIQWVPCRVITLDSSDHAKN